MRTSRQVSIIAPPRLGSAERREGELHRAQHAPAPARKNKNKKERQASFHLLLLLPGTLLLQRSKSPSLPAADAKVQISLASTQEWGCARSKSPSPPAAAAAAAAAVAAAQAPNSLLPRLSRPRTSRFPGTLPQSPIRGRSAAAGRLPECGAQQVPLAAGELSSACSNSRGCPSQEASSHKMVSVSAQDHSSGISPFSFSKFRLGVLLRSASVLCGQGGLSAAGGGIGAAAANQRKAGAGGWGWLCCKAPLQAQTWRRARVAAAAGVGGCLGLCRSDSSAFKPRLLPYSSALANRGGGLGTVSRQLRRQRLFCCSVASRDHPRRERRGRGWGRAGRAGSRQACGGAERLSGRVGPMPDHGARPFWAAVGCVEALLVI